MFHFQPLCFNVCFEVYKFLRVLSDNQIDKASQKHLKNEQVFFDYGK